LRRKMMSIRLLAAVLAAGAAAALALGIALAAPGDHAAQTITAQSGFSCAGAPSAPNVVTTPVDPRLLENVGVLRRPATAQDTPTEVAQRRLHFGRGAHIAAARLIRSGADGRAWMVPMDDVRVPPLPLRCIAKAPTAEQRRALRQQRERYLHDPPVPGVVLATEGAPEVGPQEASLVNILSGHALEMNSCAGPNRDMISVEVLLPDSASQPFLRFADGHTILGELRDNAVTFLFARPATRDGLPDAFAWTEGGAERSTPLPGGDPFLHPCAARPTWVFSRAVTGHGRIEAVARGEAPDHILHALALQVRQTDTGICPTIGLRKGDVLRRHVATYCVASTVYDDEHFFASAQRAARFGNRVLLTGVADPRTVRWIEVETDDGAFLVRPSRSGAFFVAYRGSLPDGKRWRLRAALKGGRPIPFTAYRTVSLSPTRAGVAPPGAAPAINAELLRQFAVFRAPAVTPFLTAPAARCSPRATPTRCCPATSALCAVCATTRSPASGTCASSRWAAPAAAEGVAGAPASTPTRRRPPAATARSTAARCSTGCSGMASTT
jgi:hypothetical protein